MRYFNYVWAKIIPYNKGKQSGGGQGEIRRVSLAWACYDEASSSYKQWSYHNRDAKVLSNFCHKSWHLVIALGHAGSYKHITRWSEGLSPHLGANVLEIVRIRGSSLCYFRWGWHKTFCKWSWLFISGIADLAPQFVRASVSATS